VRSHFGLQLIAITKNQTFSKTSDLRRYGVHGKCSETGTRFLSRWKINDYCEVWMTTGFGTRFNRLCHALWHAFLSQQQHWRHHDRRK